MIKHFVKLDKNYNVIEFIEKDSEDNIVDGHKIYYYNNGNIKRIKYHNGHITDFDIEGKDRSRYLSYKISYTYDETISLDELYDEIGLVKESITDLEVKQFNDLIYFFKQEMWNNIGIPKQYINDT